MRQFARRQFLTGLAAMFAAWQTGTAHAAPKRRRYSDGSYGSGIYGGN